MYAAKSFLVDVVIRGETPGLPAGVGWTNFAWRNFTNSAEFDDTLPVADGQVENELSTHAAAAFFSDGLAAWA